MKAKKFATQIDEKTLKDLRSFAKKSDINISKIVNEAIIEYLGKHRVRPLFMKVLEETFEENK